VPPDQGFGQPKGPEQQKDAVNARCSGGRGYVTYFRSAGVNEIVRPGEGLSSVVRVL